MRTGFVFSETISVEGITYRSIPEIASKLGMNISSDDYGQKVTLESKWSKVEFVNGSRLIKVNGAKMHLGFSLFEKEKTLYMPELDWQFTLSPILIPVQISPHQKRIHSIIIDPGHGGKDPGAQNSKLGLKEKELTLAVSKLLEKQLKKMGYKVYLTRRTDKFIELGDRPLLASKKKADLFISIHFNASENDSAVGVESYAYTLLNQPSSSRSTTDNVDRVFRRANRNDSLNVLLAYYLQTSILKNTNEVDRGIKRARFTVLETLPCPGALVELGFINNPQTGANLKTTAYLESLANGILEAIVQYQTRINPS